VLTDEKGNEMGLVECKSTSAQNYKLWEEDEENCVQGIPLYMYCQVQHELSVTGLLWCDLAILITDRRQLKVKRILRDEEYIKKQNEALVLWWNAYVVAMVPPEMDEKEWGYVDPQPDSFIEATAEILSVVDELKELKEDKKKIEKDLEDAEKEIKLFLADKENITSAGDVVVSWKSQNRLYPDTEKLKAELSDYESKYTKLVTFRVLRIK
jgi:predicted phage-related endonuclease